MEFMDVTDTGCLTWVITVRQIYPHFLIMSSGSRAFSKFTSFRRRMTKRRHGEIWYEAISCSTLGGILIEFAVPARVRQKSEARLLEKGGFGC